MASAWKKQLKKKMNICRYFRSLGAALACVLLLSACSKDRVGNELDERGE